MDDDEEDSDNNTYPDGARGDAYDEVGSGSASAVRSMLGRFALRSSGAAVSSMPHAHNMVSDVS